LNGTAIVCRQRALVVGREPSSSPRAINNTSLEPCSPRPVSVVTVYTVAQVRQRIFYDLVSIEFVHRRNELFRSSHDATTGKSLDRLQSVTSQPCCAAHRFSASL